MTKENQDSKLFYAERDTALVTQVQPLNIDHNEMGFVGSACHPVTNVTGLGKCYYLNMTKTGRIREIFVPTPTLFIYYY